MSNKNMKQYMKTIFKINGKTDTDTDNDIVHENEGSIIKRTKIMVVMGISLIIVGFLLPFTLIMMRNVFNVSESMIEAVYFGCSIVGIILLFKAQPYILLTKCIILGKEYDNLELSELDNMEKSSLTKELLENGFTYAEEGYYEKKELTILQDNIYYYVRMVDGNELENIVLQELECFNKAEKSKKISFEDKNLCIILFVYMNNMGDKDKKYIKKFGERNNIFETVVDTMIGMSVITVGVDCKTYKGYFFDIDEVDNVTIYSHGCKLLKSIFKKRTTAMK